MWDCWYVNLLFMGFLIVMKWIFFEVGGWVMVVGFWKVMERWNGTRLLRGILNLRQMFSSSLCFSFFQKIHVSNSRFTGTIRLSTRKLLDKL